MRSYRQICGGLLVALAAMLLAGCANDESATPVHGKDLGTQKGETLVPYEPVVSRKITQDPSTFPMPSAPAVAEAPATAPAAGEAVPGAAAPGDEFAILAKQVVDALVAGQYAKLAESFDPNLKTALPEAQLQATWEAVVANAGAYKAQGSVRREQADGFEVAIVTCQMEKGAIDVKVAFDPAKQISGLFITPAGAADLASAPPSPEAEEMAKDLMTSLDGGQFAAIEERLGPQLKTVLAPGALQQQWTAATEKFGKYQSIVKSVGRKVTQNGQTFDYAEAVLQFEKGTLVLVVAFDSQKQIIELIINPGQAASGEPSAPAAAPVAAPSATPDAAPAAPAAAPARPAAARPAARPAAQPAGGRNVSGPSGMGELPPTAPAPIGLGN